MCLHQRGGAHRQPNQVVYFLSVGHILLLVLDSNVCLKLATGSLPLGVTSLRRSTITLGAEEGDEFATLPQSEVVDLGDIQLDHPPSNSQATALHYANNNNEGEEKHLQDGSRGHGDVILLSRNEGDVGDNMNTMSASTSYAPGVKIISATGNERLYLLKSLFF